MKKIILLAIFAFLLTAKDMSGQVKLTYYTNESAGIDFNLLRLNESSNLSFEYRTSVNRDFEELTNWFNLYYNLKNHEKHGFAFGVGLRTDPFYEAGDGTAIVFPFLFEFYPISELKQLSLVFELVPELYLEEKYILASSIGIRYGF